MADDLHSHLPLDGSDWEIKPFYGMDWLLRNSHKPDTRDTGGWLSGATVPGSIVHDLWQRGEIPDPYVDRNSLLIEWVPQRTWVYRTRFTVPAGLQGRRMTLHFEGVDYAAQFFLNGKRLGDHASMYTPVEFEVSPTLRYGAENLLAVVLEPAPVEQPQVSRTSLVRTHKSRMSYWWDFCPRMVHLGIWDHVTLQVTGPHRLREVWVRPGLKDEFTRAEVGVQITLDNMLPAQVAVVLSFRGKELARATAEAEHGLATLSLDVRDPALWWPNGYGDQPLYQLRAAVIDPRTGAESDCREVTFGIRQIDFVPNETSDHSALPYTPQVNGRRIYIKGWNWVPIDVLYGVEHPVKLEHLLTLARRAQVNLLRVWGGGLIEKEAFYELCDRFGIMVWQEFIQSSSGIDNFPADDPDHLARLEAEARQIVPRRRNHPSLAIWCGGNELARAPEQPLDDTHPVLALLHRVVEELDPGRMWLPTSPSGRVFSNKLTQIARDPLAQHDVHGPWEHQGLVAQYTLYNAATSLLHSEFGAEGITNRKTLEATVSAGHRWPVTLNDPVWFHRGAWWVKEKQWRESLGEAGDLETLLHGTQYLQAEGVRYAIESNRCRQFQNSGSLPWQFNEPYPMAACTSAADYFGHPKPLYYAVARAYAPEIVGARMARQSWADQATFEAEWWAAHQHEAALDRTLRARLIGLDGMIYAEQTQAITLRPHAITPAGKFEAALATLPDLFVLDLSLWAASGSRAAYNRYLFTRQPDLASAFQQPPATLSFAVNRDIGPDTWLITVENTGRQAALGLWLEDDRPRGMVGWPLFSDNHLCLLPGESCPIEVTWNGVPTPERRIAINGWNVIPAIL